uniref:malonyl-ACP O-methyltransferase BioC n=1 Tax=Candidatus Electronema sp. TaxID=2698783 RepID=UPI0040578CB7
MCFFSHAEAASSLCSVSPALVDKDLLRQQFRRAAASYEQQAVIQRRTAERLLDLLAQHCVRPPQQVLEIGCCTGLLTRSLIGRFSGIRELILNDLVPDFASRLDLPAFSPAVRLLPGDIEKLPLPGGLDLVLSASTFHWLHDLDGLLVKLAACLRPGGLLAFSLYGPENLREIRALTGIGLRYRSLTEIAASLRRHFTLLHSSHETVTLRFASPQDVLRHLRQTGVNALSRSPWSRARLEQFCAEYRRRFSADDSGVALSYHPLYFVARRGEDTHRSCPAT